MKPLSIKIEAYGPYTAEQTAEAFQKYCFSKGVTWPSIGSKVKHTSEGIFFVMANHFDVDFCLTAQNYPSGKGPEDYLHFTLPQDWKAFTEYLDKYIAFHTKPEPEAWQHWKTKSGLTVFIESAKVGGVGAKTKYGSNIRLDYNEFDRKATPEEIAEFNNPEVKIGEHWQDDANQTIKITDTADRNGYCLMEFSSGKSGKIYMDFITRPSTPEEIEAYKKESLLSEAKRLYKEGDRVKCLYRGQGELGDGFGGDLFHWGVNPCELSLWGYGKEESFKVYEDGKWAEILPKETREEQLEEALRKITKYYDMNVSQGFLESIHKAKELLNKKQ